MLWRHIYLFFAILGTLFLIKMTQNPLHCRSCSPNRSAESATTCISKEAIDELHLDIPVLTSVSRMLKHTRTAAQVIITAAAQSE